MVEQLNIRRKAQLPPVRLAPPSRPPPATLAGHYFSAVTGGKDLES